MGKLEDNMARALDSSVVGREMESKLLATGDWTEAEAADIAFHMTDWLTDLEEYYEFCQNPACLSPEAVEKLLIGFVAHVPNHVVAAHKLLMDEPVTDLFGLGAVSEDKS